MTESHFTTVQLARILKRDPRHITQAVAMGTVVPDGSYRSGEKLQPLFNGTAERATEIEETLRNPALANQYIEGFESQNPGMLVGEMELGRPLIARTKPAASELAEQCFARYKRENGTLIEFVRRGGQPKQQ